MSKPLYPGWRMTVDQHGLYWSLWRDVCKANGWNKLKNAEVNEKRAMLHARAFGGPKSATQIDQGKEFDAIKAEFLAWCQPANLEAQMVQQRQPRVRLEYAITNERAALLTVLLAFTRGRELQIEDATLEDQLAAEDYIIRLMARFGTTDITQISAAPDPQRTSQKSDLECLRDTLDARIGELRHKTPWTWHALKMRAGVRCDCARCLRTATACGTGVAA